jgi:hypothetical protein
MDWKEVAAKISDLAPRVGSAVGGPVGALAGMAVQVLAKALGIPEAEVTPEKVAAAVEQDPDIRLKLMAAENDFTLKMRGLQIDELKADLADIQNARQADVERTKWTGKRDINLYVLAWVIIGGFIGLIVTMLVLQFVYGKVLQNDPLVTLLMGSLSTDAGMVVGYFFGSSMGSKDKDALVLRARALTSPPEGDRRKSDASR